MDICYSCCENRKLTNEHVIPQALGGRLYAPIYCKVCNDQYGKEIDAELIKNLGYVGTALNIKRTSGSNRPYALTLEENDQKLTFDGRKITRKDPIVRIKKNGKTINSVDVRARNEGELNAILSSIRMKYELDEKLYYFPEIYPSPVDAATEFVLDNSLIRRCVSKIAYSLLCIKLPPELVMSKSFDDVRNYIRLGSSDHLATANYVHTSFMTDNIRPLHKIHICMNRKESLVIGFVCLFGMFRYSVLLSKSFNSLLSWPGLDHTIDPVTSNYIPGRSGFIAPQIDAVEVLSPKHNKILIEKELEKGLRIIKSYNENIDFLKVEAGK